MEPSTQALNEWAKTECPFCKRHSVHTKSCTRPKDEAAVALGSRNSEKKKRTARENGKKGGRPKKVK